MNRILPKVLLACVAISATCPALHAADLPNFTSRVVTDPLLKIQTSTKLLPEKDDNSIGGRRDESHKPPLYKKALGKFDVFMLEPFSRTKGAEVDFSPVTSNSKGKLTIYIRNHPYGDFDLEIMKADQKVAEQSVGKNRWESFVIPYDHQPVILKAKANGWAYEFAFLNYAFSN